MSGVNTAGSSNCRPSGETYFQHTLPCDTSSLVRWRKRIGQPGVELLLRETVQAAERAKVVEARSYDKLIVDTTVQEKAIADPTDSNLLDGVRRKLCLDRSG